MIFIGLIFLNVTINKSEHKIVINTTINKLVIITMSLTIYFDAVQITETGNFRCNAIFTFNNQNQYYNNLKNVINATPIVAFSVPVLSGILDANYDYDASIDRIITGYPCTISSAGTMSQFKVKCAFIGEYNE